MKFRGLDIDGDWQLGSGLQSYVSDQDATAADIGTRLKVFLGECFFALDFGVDWWNLLGARGVQAEQDIVLQCRQMISSCQDVTRINSVVAVEDRDTRALSLEYNVDTVYSRNSNGEVVLPQ